MLGAERGDTIVEVVLAFAVFSMVSIGAMTILTQGTNAAQRALEITQVRQHINAQAEALRASQQAFTATGDVANNAWSDIAKPAETENSVRFAYDDRCPADESDVSRSFIMDPTTATAVTTDWFEPINYNDEDAGPIQPYANVSTEGGINGRGIWIERTYVNGDNGPDIYDFVIKACWYAAGMSNPMKLETSVRLYEPRA